MSMRFPRAKQDRSLDLKFLAYNQWLQRINRPGRFDHKNDLRFLIRRALKLDKVFGNNFKKEGNFYTNLDKPYTVLIDYLRNEKLSIGERGRKTSYLNVDDTKRLRRILLSRSIEGIFSAYDSGTAATINAIGGLLISLKPNDKRAFLQFLKDSIGDDNISQRREISAIPIRRPGK